MGSTSMSFHLVYLLEQQFLPCHFPCKSYHKSRGVIQECGFAEALFTSAVPNHVTAPKAPSQEPIAAKTT